MEKEIVIEWCASEVYYAEAMLHLPAFLKKTLQESLDASEGKPINPFLDALTDDKEIFNFIVHAVSFFMAKKREGEKNETTQES